jgi:hypothetical protein
MANVTNVTDVTNAQEQVEVIVSIVWLSPLTWKTNERHTRSERVCDRLQCLQTEDEKANIILLDSIRVTLHYTWLGTSWHTTCTSLHISAFSGWNKAHLSSSYCLHTSTIPAPGWNSSPLGKEWRRRRGREWSRVVATHCLGSWSLMLFDDHWS